MAPVASSREQNELTRQPPLSMRHVSEMSNHVFSPMLPSLTTTYLCRPHLMLSQCWCSHSCTNIDKHSFWDHASTLHSDHIHRCSPGNYLQRRRETLTKPAKRDSITSADDIGGITSIAEAGLASADDSVGRDAMGAGSIAIASTIVHETAV